MTSFYKILLCLSSSILIGCSSIEKGMANFKEDNIIMSSAKGESFSYKSDNPNLICFAFLNKFQDSIVVYNNRHDVLHFRRNDSLSYKEMRHEEIFKTFSLDTKDSINKIQIFLVNEKSKVSFNLSKNKSLYLISRYNNSWYVTIWDND